MMVNEPPNPSEVSALRSLVEGFIQDRLKPKLEEIEKKIAKAIEEEADTNKLQVLQAKRQQLIADYQRETWLESAAKRASQIQLVTHALKFTHPNARGSSLYLGESEAEASTEYVGTHSLGNNRQDDVVGNAAALDVFKFLSLAYQGVTLLQRVRSGDSVLLAALDDDIEQARGWINQFAAITGSGNTHASHKLAKQLYFPLSNSDEAYHLLAPLFPTSLVHDVHERLRQARFSEETKQARQARYDSKPFAHGYHEFPNMAVQIFGGTKPQNISQLNSQRYGENWLLPSCPPIWRSDRLRPPLGVTTVFRRWFGGRPTVREVTETLIKFLADTDYNNEPIRRTRGRLVGQLSDELLLFAAELHELPSGWSSDTECRLDQVETLWLDPGRAELDEDFGALRQRGEWQDEIATRFGSWLNNQLHRKKRLPVGDVEQAEWQKEIKEGLTHD